MRQSSRRHRVVAAFPQEVLVDILKALFDDVRGAGWHTTCRIECSLFLIVRVRLVCRAWREAVESDAVARHTFGDCCPLGEEAMVKSAGVDARPRSRKYNATGILGADERVGAWHSLVDPHSFKDHWGRDPEWPRQIYREPGVRHWRDITVTMRDGKPSLKHDGDCTTPGGWFDLLVDFTMISWFRAKMGEALFDDNIGGYYEDYRASVPVMFSNECAAILEKLKKMDPTAPSTETTHVRSSNARSLVNRVIFDLATAKAYLPSFPLCVDRVRELRSCTKMNFARFVGHLGPSPWHEEASSICVLNCSSCASSIGGLYFNWNGNSLDRYEDAHRFHQFDARWVVTTLLRRFEGLNCPRHDSASPPPRPTALFYADSVPIFENFPYHAYVLTVNKRSGRLMGLYSWFETGERP
ncbi:hypothetical protein DFJ73DRAFT_864732 [Zopfochytrium polystomum]|nr:hypothetical protein DFJ73DRAFT_864732 [Zopfochytrium polystomum]